MTYCPDDRFNQEIRAERFAQISNATQLLRLAQRYFVIEGGHKYDWKRETGIRQLTRQLHPRNIPKLNVDNEALRLARCGGTEECLGRIEGVCDISESRQKRCRRLSHTRIIIDDRYNVSPNRRHNMRNPNGNARGGCGNCFNSWLVYPVDDGATPLMPGRLADVLLLWAKILFVRVRSGLDT